MLRIVLSIMACTLCLTVVYPQVKVGDNPLEIDEASLIEIESTSKGFLPSRMTTTQRDLQPAWKAGHIIYNTSESCLQIFNGVSWDCFVKGELIDSTIYKYNGVLTSDRVMTLDGNSFFFDAAGSTDVVIQPDGDVGIGTTTPNARLDVENGTVRFSDYGSGTIGGTAGYVLGVDLDGDVIEIDTATFLKDNQTIDLFELSNDTLLLSIEGDQVDPSKVDLSRYAIDTSIYNDNGTLTEDRTLTLGGYNLTFSGTNNVTFESTGELGIGEPIPDAPIHINEITGTPATATDGTLILEHNDDGGASSLVFKSSVNEGSDYGYIQFEDDGSGNGVSTENALLTIGVGDDGLGINQDDIAIMSSGNVGIGTIAPDEKLHVAGNMRLDGAFEDKDGEAGSTGQVLTSTNSGTDWVDANTIGTDDQVIDSLALNGTQLDIGIEGDINGTQSVDLSELQGGSVDLHDDVDISTIMPSAGDVLAWNGTNFVPQETDNAYTIFNIWAEESATLDASSTEWAFGNGDNTPTGHGIVIPIDCELWAMSLDHENGANTIVRVIKNSDSSLSAYQVTTSGAEQGYNIFSSPLSFSAGDVLNFNTISASVGGTSGRVSAWFRIRATPVSNILIEELMDVSATAIDSGQVLIYDGASYVPGDNTDDQVIDSFALTGNILSISIEDDNVAPLSVDFTDILGSTENIYNADGTLEANRTVSLGGSSLTFDGTDDGDVIMESDGDLGIGTLSPSGDIEAISDEDQNAYSFVQEDITTGEKDVFTIEDQDIGDGNQDESSVLKVHKSGTINSGDTGFSLIELANTGSDPGDNKYWISGRKTDEGLPLWGVDITDNDYWSEGGIILGVTGADGGTYSGGTFRVEPDGDVGIGTTTPGARLEVNGGNVRFSDYGVGTYGDTTANYILATNPNGDVVELNTAKNTRWFYPPAIIIDASDLDTAATLDLHADYVTQFSSPLVSSDGASGYVPHYQQDELEYYVTFYDNTILDNISIDSDGVMTYDIISVPFDNYTVINVVFVIKDP